MSLDAVNEQRNLQAQEHFKKQAERRLKAAAFVRERSGQKTKPTQQAKPSAAPIPAAQAATSPKPVKSHKPGKHARTRPLRHAQHEKQKDTELLMLRRQVDAMSTTLRSIVSLEPNDKRPASRLLGRAQQMARLQLEEVGRELLSHCKTNRSTD